MRAGNGREAMIDDPLKNAERGLEMGGKHCRRPVNEWRMRAGDGRKPIMDDKLMNGD
jgi:hypothetical protein